MTAINARPGMEGRVSHIVEDEDCTERGGHRLLSTPNMVKFAEQAAVEALRPCLESGQISVGTHIDLRHVSPTPLGLRVEARAAIREVDGLRVLFDVEIRDGIDIVGSGCHERYVLELDRYLRRLEKKVEAARAAQDRAFST
jgi:predicted thioesterase